MIARCRVCGCTEVTACLGSDGRPCHWANADHTLCSVCADRDEAGQMLRAYCWANGEIEFGYAVPEAVGELDAVTALIAWVEWARPSWERAGLIVSRDEP